MTEWHIQKIRGWGHVGTPQKQNFVLVPYEICISALIIVWVWLIPLTSMAAYKLFYYDE